MVMAEAINLAGCLGGLTDGMRVHLGKAARLKAGWFKSVTWMENVANDIIGPDLPNADQVFSQFLYDWFEWMERAGG
jgi:putative ATP-dependent endonuclease of OLD family